MERFPDQSQVTGLARGIPSALLAVCWPASSPPRTHPPLFHRKKTDKIMSAYSKQTGSN